MGSHVAAEITDCELAALGVEAGALPLLGRELRKHPQVGFSQVLRESECAAQNTIRANLFESRCFNGEALRYLGYAPKDKIGKRWTKATTQQGDHFVDRFDLSYCGRPTLRTSSA